MEVQAGKPLHPLAWVVALALIVFCGAGFAALMGWIPTSIGKPDEPVLTQGQSPAASRPAKTAAATPATARATTPPALAAAPAPVVAVAKCADCGVVQSVQAIDAKGEGSGLGAVGGAVVGGVLGNQVGGGSGKSIMTVVGAVGGAMAGNEVEKRVKTARHYEITVRLDDGTNRVVTEANPPTWRPGDKVKVVNGAIQSNG